MVKNVLVFPFNPVLKKEVFFWFSFFNFFLGQKAHATRALRSVVIVSL